MRRLSSAFFLLGPWHWRSYSLAVTRGLSLRQPYQRYDCTSWKSVQLFGIRFYWGHKPLPLAGGTP